MTFLNIQGEELLGRVVGGVRFPEDPQRRGDGTLRARWKIGFYHHTLSHLSPKNNFWPQPIHSKSEKVCGTAYSLKKNCEKVRAIFGPFWVLLGHFGPFWVTLGHFGSFFAILGPFRGFFGQICGKFKFFCGPVGVAGLAFRMYASTIDWSL